MTDDAVVAMVTAILDTGDENLAQKNSLPTPL